MELKFGLMGFRNALSYGQVRQEIDLSKLGTVHIVGENLDEGGSSGSGKSTIPAVLTWLLYDKVPSGISKDRLINNINDAKNVLMEGDLQFWAGADEYLLKKTRGAKNSIQLFKNGIDETPASVAAFNAKIEEVIGCSFELFSQLVIFNGSAVPFLDLPARDQRELIEELFKITLLSRKAERLKEMAKETDSQLKLSTALYDQSKSKYAEALKKYELDLVDTHSKFEKWADNERSRIAAEVVAAEANLTRLKEQAASWADAEQLKLAQAVADLEKKSGDWDVAEAVSQVTRLQDLDRALSEYAPKIAKLQADLKATEEASQDKLDELQRIHQQHVDLTAELKSLNLTRGMTEKDVVRTEGKLLELQGQLQHLASNTCPFCKQAYADVAAKVAELNVGMEEAQKKLEELNEQMKAIDSEIKRAGAEYDKLPPYDVDEARRLQLLANSRPGLESQLGKLNTEKASQQTELDYLRANPDSKRPNPYVDQVKAAEMKLAAFDPTNNPWVGQVAVAEKRYLDAQTATVDESRNPYATQLEYFAVNEPKAPDASIEQDLNRLMRHKEHQQVLLKLLTDKNSFIRKAIISKTLPFLNKRIAYYTQRLGLPHIVNFQSDLTVDITKMGVPLDHGNLSGGEKQRLNFSLCLSFRDALTYLHSKISFLVTDEIDGGKLDEQAVNNIIALIKHKSWDDKLTIFNISHRPEFDGRCDRTLVVRKEGGFSKIIKQADS